MITDSLKDREEDIISEFEMFDDWMDKYEYIIDLGKELEVFPLKNKKEENLIRGCQSQVWLTS
jgi:cysteine desulfuration protein SufE